MRDQLGAALCAFISDDRGATAIEYALIGSGLSIVILGAVNATGGTVTGLFDTVVTAFGGGNS
ncbi:MAG: Flp family type IVb pilin [Pseudomonadota bacterium]